MDTLAGQLKGANEQVVGGRFAPLSFFVHGKTAGA
jgi:hypothetical protein